MSCSSSGEANQSFDVNVKFVHKIPNCDNSGNPEMNCREIITFIDASTVDVLIGGGDIVERARYSLANNKIDIDVSNTDISFNVKNDSTLIHIGDNEIWTKIK